MRLLENGFIMGSDYAERTAAFEADVPTPSAGCCCVGPNQVRSGQLRAKQLQVEPNVTLTPSNADTTTEQ